MMINECIIKYQTNKIYQIQSTSDTNEVKLGIQLPDGMQHHLKLLKCPN